MNHPPIKSKKRPKRLRVTRGTIVRYQKRFGFVTSSAQDQAIGVRFPEPHDKASYQDQHFCLNGTLLGDGEQVLFIHQSSNEALESLCRDLSCRVETVDIRLENSKPKIQMDGTEVEEEEMPDW